MVRGVLGRIPLAWPEGTGRPRIAVSRDALRFVRGEFIGPEILAVVLAAVGSGSPRKGDRVSAVEEVIGPHSESVLLTRTAPPGPRWIEVNRWEDLVRASRFMGRPILRLDDGTRTVDQPLFYIPDGPQSYVYDFQREGVKTSTSGGYMVPPAPATPTVTESVPTLTSEPSAPVEPASDGDSVLPEPALRGAAPVVSPPQEAPVVSDLVVDQYLGPDVREPEAGGEIFARNTVEQDIRAMIRDVLVSLRKLPAGSRRVEEGSYHLQRAMELLREGRYGSAQIEVNRAQRLAREGHRE
jgi:hypothetical protein